IQGLASLRIGYGLAPAHLAEVLQKCRQPFNANAIAQAGALAGLLDLEHQGRTRAVNREGRDYLQQSFAEMGLEYVPSHANFVLVKVGDGDRVFKEMLNRGVIIRAMRGYKLPDWVRISVGTMEQNRRCIATLRDVLATA
ncbi:MAG: aminotransferase class I/II-fold pyridoxal phosphate-dependent enzyme, partial [Verrucomicrobiae bacterium]|nr:aminotransferase class I/II-fold pyridoxal phosphate-dependent enzyme [Verrucomicrobiae bacterium]